MRLLLTLLGIFAASILTFAGPLNMTRPALSITNASLTTWPETPYTTYFGTIKFTILSYGDLAPPGLDQEIQLDFNSLHRQIVSRTEPFSGISVDLHSFVISVAVDFIDARKMSRYDLANVIVALKAEMSRRGARGIERAVIGVEIHRSGRYRDVAELRLRFEDELGVER